jgi:hypothetical protein
MPIEKVPNSSLTYYLIAFDKDGNERDEADGKKLSQQIFSALAKEPNNRCIPFEPRVDG